MSHKDNLTTIPAYSADLIAILGSVFPPRCMKRGETLEDHHRYAGKVELNPA